MRDHRYQAGAYGVCKRCGVSEKEHSRRVRTAPEAIPSTDWLAGKVSQAVPPAIEPSRDDEDGYDERQS